MTEGLAHIQDAPQDHGTLDLIARRPDVDLREILQQGELDLVEGLRGDRWHARENRHADKQLNVMNTRVVDLLAGGFDRWALAGDQLYVDLDISEKNLPAGTRLAIGVGAVIEVTPSLHTGCSKFRDRFGADALAFVNSPEGRKMRLRGLCAKVIVPGVIRPGDTVAKVG